MRKEFTSSSLSLSMSLIFFTGPDFGTCEFEVTELNSEVRSDLRGCLEATMASGATKMAVRGNMHNDTRVIEVADFKFEVKFEL